MSGPVVALSGGVGGAKLAQGLYQHLGPDRLTVVVNTGDDFRHLGLWISPDIDSVVYALAGLDDPERGWGRRAETWSFMAALESLGGPQWFRLGDRDLAMHVERTRRLAAGERLSEVTRAVCESLGIRARVVPMSDDEVSTYVETDEGVLGFQQYFVERRCEPQAKGFAFHGAAAARPNADAIAEIGRPDLAAIILCPSNPFVSIDPILAVPGMRSAIAAASAPVIAVTPIIGGGAVKGPAAKMMRELGMPVTGVEVARHYGALIDAFVLDEVDAAETAPAADAPVPLLHARTLMRTPDDRRRLAEDVMAIARRLPRRGR